jgi:arginyl-tRNA synthetase
LARTYNSFYQENQILREENEQKRNLRLALTEKTGAVVRDAMGLLGISMPERM